MDEPVILLRNICKCYDLQTGFAISCFVTDVERALTGLGTSVPLDVSTASPE
jgi:hypothetical protein